MYIYVHIHTHIYIYTCICIHTYMYVVLSLTHKYWFLLLSHPSSILQPFIYIARPRAKVTSCVKAQLPPLLGFSSVLFCCSACDSLADLWISQWSVSCSGRWASGGQRKSTHLCTGIPRFTVLRFIAFVDPVFFTNWRRVATLHPASLLAHFSNSISSLHVSIAFW